jgi:F-type H+-transporting ATPase subunit a
MTNITGITHATVDKSAAVQAFIMHHVSDFRVWNWLPGGHTHLPAFLTVHGVMVMGSGILLVVLLALACRRPAAVPHGWFNLVEFFVKYIRDEMAIPFLGEADGRKMTPLLCSFFFYILTMNLVGLVPCFYSATANINVTAGLASVTLFFMLGGAMYRHGPVAFIKGFIPPDVPWPLLIVIIPIEFIGVFIKAAALAIRLFVNELAGHIVVFSLIGLIVMFGVLALPAFFMAIAIFVLEVFIAFLQAYIFTLLSAVFMGQRYHPAH